MSEHVVTRWYRAPEVRSRRFLREPSLRRRAGRKACSGLARPSRLACSVAGGARLVRRAGSLTGRQFPDAGASLARACAQGVPGIDCAATRGLR